ncbi:MAG TPA: hypothetical protein VGV40_07845 [Solirubrobacteraceae bacterium]|nr:hypothetical protein [Solirubrobacteraceae bacterium]
MRRTRPHAADGTRRPARPSLGAAQAGQATVETVAWLPVLFAVVAAVGCLLAAGAARELAGHAAEAGAVAILQGGDPVGAARDALPGWSRERVTVRRRGRTVHVRVRPPIPVRRLADALAATARADAGPPDAGS